MQGGQSAKNNDWAPAAHTPVLLNEVLDALDPKAGESFLDGTFGAGGYTTAILDRAPCHVLALDRDMRAIEAARVITPRYPDRLTVVHAPFGTMAQVARDFLTPHGTPPTDKPLLDGIVLDLGVSSMQLDEAARGFSFQRDGPLDMRMSQTGPFAGQTAADLVNTASADTLADILFHYGDERKSRSIARAIVMDRVAEPFTRTKQLADLVGRILKTRSIDGRHPATRTFQALRIAINDELGELERALEASIELLKPGGRLVLVTFQSLEDVIVKRFLKVESGRTARGSRHGPAQNVIEVVPRFHIVNPRGVTSGPEELARNPRARSARLRLALRTETR